MYRPAPRPLTLVFPTRALPLKDDSASASRSGDGAAGSKSKLTNTRGLNIVWAPKASPNHSTKSVCDQKNVAKRCASQNRYCTKPLRGKEGDRCQFKPDLSLHKDPPIPRAVQTVGRALAMSVLGGLHHQYFRA